MRIMSLRLRPAPTMPGASGPQDGSTRRHTKPPFLSINVRRPISCTSSRIIVIATGPGAQSRCLATRLPSDAPAVRRISKETMTTIFGIQCAARSYAGAHAAQARRIFGHEGIGEVYLTEQTSGIGVVLGRRFRRTGKVAKRIGDLMPKTRVHDQG